MVQVIDRADYELPDLNRGPPPRPAWLRSLLGDDFFATVVGGQMLNSHAEATDADLELYRRLPSLDRWALTDPRSPMRG